jgi:hypothetical protein
LPPYSPDLNPDRASLRQTQGAAAHRRQPHVAALWQAIGHDAFTPAECAHYLARRLCSTSSGKALATAPTSSALQVSLPFATHRAHVGESMAVALAS